MEVALAIMSDPSGKHWGYALMQESGVRSGVLYPILARMLTDGWLSGCFRKFFGVDHAADGSSMSVSCCSC